jgi:hypothetical protein
LELKSNDMVQDLSWTGSAPKARDMKARVKREARRPW